MLSTCSWLPASVKRSAIQLSWPTELDRLRPDEVLVGSGGSPFDNASALNGTQPVTDRYYAWANVRIFQSGKVEITGYGFSDAYGPTKLLDVVSLPR